MCLRCAFAAYIFYSHCGDRIRRLGAPSLWLAPEQRYDPARTAMTSISLLSEVVRSLSLRRVWQAAWSSRDGDPPRKGVAFVATWEYPPTSLHLVYARPFGSSSEQGYGILDYNLLTWVSDASSCR